MRGYTSCIVLAAWLCASARADDDNAGYTPPEPLREAVTSRSAATDINDTSLAGTQDKNPVEVAESLRQGVSTPAEIGNDSNLSNAGSDGSSSTPIEGTKISEIAGTPDAAVDSVSEATSNVAPAVPQIDEIVQKPMAPAMTQTNQRLYTDPITEMMGGAFNTEDNQRMAESFLSIRPRVMHLKANRDY